MIVVIVVAMIMVLIRIIIIMTMLIMTIIIRTVIMIIDRNGSGNRNGGVVDTKESAF